jgi:hypothetical protein
LQGASLAATYWRAIYPNDSLLPVLSILFVGALIWGFWKKQSFLLLWTVIPVIVEPRSALNVVVFPLSILLASLLFDLKIYFQSKGAAGPRNSMLGFFVLILYLFSESYLFSRQLVNVSLTQADRNTMTWIREYTTVDSRFVLLTGIAGPELDAFQEWFPALAERKSMTTFQGTEWTLGPQFLPWLRELRGLQACATAACMQTWVNQNQVSFDYIVVKKSDRSTELLLSLRSDASYENIYEDVAAVIFAPQ